MVCLMYRRDQFFGNVFASAWSPQAWSHGPEDVPQRHEWIWCRRHMTTRRRCWRHGVLILPAAPHLFFTLCGWLRNRAQLAACFKLARWVSPCLFIPLTSVSDAGQPEPVTWMNTKQGCQTKHGPTTSETRSFSAKILMWKWSLTKCVKFQWAAVVSRLP